MAVWMSESHCVWCKTCEFLAIFAVFYFLLLMSLTCFSMIVCSSCVLTTYSFSSVASPFTPPPLLLDSCNKNNKKRNKRYRIYVNIYVWNIRLIAHIDTHTHTQRNLLYTPSLWCHSHRWHCQWMQRRLAVLPPCIGSAPLWLCLVPPPAHCSFRWTDAIARVLFRPELCGARTVI